MKKILLFFSFIGSLSAVSLHAQVENVIVEKYYISDTTDAKDTVGGHLPSGSITYRVYIDLVKGSKLKKIYGDANHVLKIVSDSVFFNNMTDGQTFSKDIGKGWYTENTLGLDTWLTLGQTTKPSVKTYFGVLKSQDKSGSFIGGTFTNNDGGSGGVPLISNDDSTAGIPVKMQDGMDTMMNVPSGWGDYGIRFSTTIDSTIFGSVVPGTQFISNNAGLQNSGVMGVNPDSNQVLVAQLTTKGDISFELNVEVEQPALPNPITLNYVANGDTLLPGEVLCPYLKYPPVCGCKDNRYLEYSPSYACSFTDSCKTLKVFGCTDPMACNYDASANVLLPNFCCYPGLCQNRDVSVACSSFGNGRVSLYPNPAQDQVAFNISADEKEAKYTIYNSFGAVVLEKNIGIVSGTVTEYVNISGLADGLYFLRLFTGETSDIKYFLKN